MVVSKAARPVTLTFDLESGVPVTCDVGYFCANFGLPMPLCSRLTHDVCDRQTSDRRHMYVCLCTCLSVTRRCCVTVKTVKPVLKLFWHSGSPIILLFLPLASVPTSKGTPSATLVIWSGRVAIFGLCLVWTGHVAEMLDLHTHTG